MRLKTGEYFIQEVFHSLRRNNWMTFASIGTVAVSLFVLGVFLILVLNMNRLAGMLESQVQISVYLEDHLTDREKRQIGYDIESLQGIDTVTYVDHALRSASATRSTCSTRSQRTTRCPTPLR